jgi:hypothetical protein
MQPRNNSLFLRALAIVGISAALLTVSGSAIAQGKFASNRATDHMSSMSHLAKKHLKAALGAYLKSHRLSAKFRAPGALAGDPGGDGEDDGGKDGVPGADDEGDGGYMENPSGGQAETSLAVDASGQHIVVGVNDTRGFNVNPTSVSGYLYSDDGGNTFIDGGQLPVTTGTNTIGTTVFPQPFGDADIRYLGGSNFVYASILLKKIGTSGTAQTMCVHVSTDFGHTWQGPYEVTSATNPHGLLSGVNARDAADKEFIDWDPAHGRLLLTWSNFTSTAFAPGGVEISSTYCDNVLSGSPTWSPRQIIAKRAEDGQASCPRFRVGTNDAYVVWRAFPGGNNQNVGFAVSHDDGATWSAPVDIAPTNFFTMDQALGNDRNNTSPSVAVNYANGNVYVVYGNNNNHDGADVMLQRSTNGGASFSAPVTLNARPGNDGPQWFPWVTVDQSSGRVHVFYYDQGPQSGDVTETSWLYSDDNGVSFSAQNPLTDRPFHAGYGNDTGQPNIGDYNQAVAQNGELFAVWAGNPDRVDYNDGEPASLSFTVPDVYFKRTSSAKAALRLGGVTFTNARASSTVDTGGTVHFQIPVQSYTPSLGFTGVSAVLSTSTPNATVIQASSTYNNVPAGGTSTNNNDYIVKLGAGYVPGTPLALSLAVTTDQGSTTLLYTQKTGTPVPSTIFSENFDSAVGGNLPAGWARSHAGGNNTVPWVTRNNTFGDSTNGLFHINANDGLAGNNVRFERAFSPAFAVPAGADYVTLDFDVGYNMEDDPAFNVQAYDGVLLRITDGTTGHLLRSVQVEAAADEFTTGSNQYYPKHLVRSSNANYFQDMNVWSGVSNGMKHVHIKLHGLAGDVLQLRWEFTQDSGGTGADVHPAGDGIYGFTVDNIVVQSVQSIVPVNNAPVANNDSAATNQDIAVNGNVLSNDTDADNDALTASVVSGPANGGVVLNPNGTFTYTPGLGFHGVDTFTYKANDGLADSNVATVTVTVDGKPTAVANGPGTVTVPHDGNPATNTTTFTLDGTASSDPEGETLGYVWSGDASGTTATLNVTKPAGTYNFTLTVTDTHGQSSAANVSVTVNPEPNAAPVANAGANQTIEATGPSTPVTLNGSASSDPDGDTITYSWKEGATVLGTTAIVNTSLPLGTHTIVLKVTDPYGATSSSTTTVVIKDTTGPTISGVSASPNSLWPPNHNMIPVTIGYTATDLVDPAGSLTNTLTITCNEPTVAGDMVVVDSHHVLLRAERLGSGTGRVYTITIHSTDLSGNTSTSTVTVTVAHDQGH